MILKIQAMLLLEMVYKDSKIKKKIVMKNQCIPFMMLNSFRENDRNCIHSTKQNFIHNTSRDNTIYGKLFTRRTRKFRSTKLVSYLHIHVIEQ